MTENRQEDTYLQLYHVADELRAIANYGIMNTSSPYAMEQYEKVLRVSARLTSIIDKQPVEDVLAIYGDNMNHVSPAIGAEAAVFSEGKLLLQKRSDNGLWAVPGGLTDVGETLTNTALRELREEGGMVGSIVRLLGVFDSRIWKSQTKFHVYHVIFEVSVESGKPAVTKEATEWGYYSADELPDLSPGHHLRVPFLFKLMDGSVKAPYFDEPAHPE
ncbi:NUDIX domain-containing protein [Chloroflexota bacterium]